MTTTTRSSFLETRLATRESAERRARLRSLEATLSEARSSAESIGRPALAYLIDMAIAEAKGTRPVDQTQGQQDGRKSNVIKFANSPARVASPAR